MRTRVLVPVAVAALLLAAIALRAGFRAPSSRVPLVSTPAAPVLLFAGTGTSSNSVAALAALLDASRIPYSTLDSSQLDDMSDERLRSHRLLIVPGGNYVTIGTSLEATTTGKTAHSFPAGAQCSASIRTARLPSSKALMAAAG